MRLVGLNLCSLSLVFTGVFSSLCVFMCMYLSTVCFVYYSSGLTRRGCLIIDFPFGPAGRCLFDDAG